MGKAIVFAGQLLLLALVSFGLHFLLHSISNDLEFWDTAYMHLWQIYALQFLMSVIMIFAVVGIGNSKPESLGYIFLGFLTLKVAVNYFVISPVLKMEADLDFFKYNFLAVFFLFMTFDVYVSYRILNQVYPTKNNS
ncbi:MAG TPA: hypothetical protein VKY33_01030 [Flavobacterium sp.]|nr:hypothetical protein [Flavobacterium sp.]